MVPPAPPWFRWLAYVMVALLAISVVLQYNDPDPVRWMAIYGAGALISAVLPGRRAAALPGVLVGLVALAWAAYLVHRTWGAIELADLTGKMSEQGGAVEEGREAGGLAIEAVWLLAAGAFRRRRA
jgi:hypothetical protein